MLFFRESKKILFSLTFLVYLIAVIAMYFTQFQGDCSEPLFDYSDENIVNRFSRVPRTYEDALAEYKTFLSEDKITNAYARLYCDYMGIVLAILPVFPAVSLASRDRRSRMEQLIYSRKISSARLIFTRFSALVVVMLIPVLVTAIIAQVTVIKLYPDQSIDTAAMFKYAAAWLIPSIMTSTAAGLLITELTSSMLAIFAQSAWWFTSIFTNIDRLTGDIGKFNLVMRHNSLYDFDLFAKTYHNFIFNRIFFTVISLIGIAVTAFIYEQKRRDNFHEIDIRFKGFGNKSET